MVRPPDMTSEELKTLAAAALAFGWGVYWFFKGFGVYREFRVLKDTPEIPIRSIAMGLIHIHGKARGEETLSSPVSNTACLYYFVVVEKWRQGSRGGGSWTDYRTDSNGVRFFLEDQSGKTLVDPNGCEVNLPTTTIVETRRTHAPPMGMVGDGLDPRLSLAMFEVSDNHLNAYAERLGEHGHAPLLSAAKLLALRGQAGYAAGLTASGSSAPAYRFTEYCIRDGDQLDVTGSCVENPDAKDVHDRNMIVKGQSEPTFLITTKSQKGIESTLRRGAMARVYGGASLAVVCLWFILWRLRFL